MKLYESEKKVGDKLSNFYMTLKYLSVQTEILTVDSSSIDILTIARIENGEDIHAILHSKTGEKKNCRISASGLIRAGVADKKMIEEITPDPNGVYTTPMMLLLIHGYYYFVSENAINTMAQRSGLAKTCAFSKANGMIRYHRDGLIQSSLYYYPSTVQILFRKEGNIRKVYAIFSIKYGYIEQYRLMKGTITKLQKELGRAVVTKWIINHIYTDIQLEFPGQAEEFAEIYDLPENIVPGIRIHTSDVGESSIIINGTIRSSRGFGYIPLCCVKKEHSRLLTENILIEKIEKKIFPEFYKIPERMTELLAIDLPNPQGVIEAVFQHCGFKRSALLGIKRSEALLGEMLSCAADMPCTAYDIASMFLEIPAKFEDEIGYRNIDAVREAAVEAVLYPYKNL